MDGVKYFMLDHKSLRTFNSANVIIQAANLRYYSEVFSLNQSNVHYLWNIISSCKYLWWSFLIKFRPHDIVIFSILIHYSLAVNDVKSLEFDS